MIFILILSSNELIFLPKYSFTIPYFSLFCATLASRPPVPPWLWSTAFSIITDLLCYCNWTSDYIVQFNNFSFIYSDCQLTGTIFYHFNYSCNIVCQRAYLLYIYKFTYIYVYIHIHILVNLYIHLSKYQLNAQLFYSSTIYMLHYAPQHVSSSMRSVTCILLKNGRVVHWVGILKGLCYDARSEKHQYIYIHKYNK